MRSIPMIVGLVIALMITTFSRVSAANTMATDHTVLADSITVQTSENPWGFDVSLRTPTDTTITFRSERDVNNNDPETTKEIPHLVLKRNGILTRSYDRTLLVTVENLSIPRSGLYLDLAIQTQHGDPDLGEGSGNQIAVWKETRYIPYSADPTKPIEFTIQFSQSYLPNSPTFQTPTDYYSYRLTLTNPQGEKLQAIEQEYAFLLENQWIVSLPKVLENSPGAAPDQLILYFCDMFPFQRDMRDPLTRLKRNEVERYVQTELTPAMVYAFEMQSNLWKFPWYSEWSNYRMEEDPKTLSVALGEYKTWYHGTSLFLGNSMISIRVDGTYGEYSTLTDGILSVFHHELFHNLQRNISLHFDGNENLSGKNNAWKMFSEGTAVLASAVGQPKVEFEAGVQPRSYAKRVKAFLGQEGLSGGGLGESYSEIPYHTAVLWRFLYEHCGGLVNGREDPTAGMEVIRHVLEILYTGKVVDIHLSYDASGSLPKIVDLALQQTPSCEFRTYEEVLLRFSESVFLLRTLNGRCNAIIDLRICGFFDPHHLYPAPDAEIYTVPANSETLIEGAIQSSFGIDLIELNLDEVENNHSMKLIFENASSMPEEFCIAVWKIYKLNDPFGSASISAGENQSTCIEGGATTLEIEPANGEDFGYIGIVISRLDSFEQQNTGEYALRLQTE